MTRPWTTQSLFGDIRSQAATATDDEFDSAI